MKRPTAYLLLAALPVFLSVPAYALDVPDLTVSRLGDVEKTCGELSQEAAAMNDIVLKAEEVGERSLLRSRGIGAAGTAASFFVGTVTGTIGLMAAGHIIREATDDDGEKADALKAVAEQRRSLMLGIYNAKGCEGPMEHVLPYADMAPAAGEEAPAKPVKPRYNE